MPISLSKGMAHHCVTKDVSGGGVSVLFGEIPSLVEGESFEVVLNVPDGREPIRAHCQVKYIREVLRGFTMVGRRSVLDDRREDRQRLVAVCVPPRTRGKSGRQAKKVNPLFSGILPAVSSTTSGSVYRFCG